MTKGSPRQELLPLGPSYLREITLPRLARVNRHTIYRRGAMRSTPGHRDDSGERNAESTTNTCPQSTAVRGDRNPERWRGPR